MTELDGVYGTVRNEQQYQQSIQSQDSRNPWISCLKHGECIGLALGIEASTLSCICAIITLIWIGWNVHRKLFQGPADIYMFSLFAFDLLQAIGNIPSRWAHNGIVTTGHYCTAQGIVEQTGELGVALIIFLLTIHTFVAAVLQVGLKALGVALSSVSLACVFIMLWVAIGPDIHKNHETPTPYWYWISPQFPGERLVGEYIWLWTGLFASAILYIPLYFCVAWLSVARASLGRTEMKRSRKNKYGQRWTR